MNHPRAVVIRNVSGTHQHQMAPIVPINGAIVNVTPIREIEWLIEFQHALTDPAILDLRAEVPPLIFAV